VERELIVRFDYLHSARPMLVTRMFELRVPARLHNAFYAVAGAVIVVAGAWGIEAYRLREALKVQTVYQQRSDEIREQLRATNLYYDRVRAVASLDRRVRRIAASGDEDARTLAEIANRLPAHAWLTSISRDESGLSLQGHAKNLEILGNVIRGLMQAQRLRHPRLMNALADKEQGREVGIKYEIHVDEAEQ
jgi:hypothetical protein